MHVHTRLCIRKRHAQKLCLVGRSVATCTLALFRRRPRKTFQLLLHANSLSLSLTHTMPKQRDKPANIIPAPLPLFSQLGAFRCPRNIGVGTMVQTFLGNYKSVVVTKKHGYVCGHVGPEFFKRERPCAAPRGALLNTKQVIRGAPSRKNTPYRLTPHTSSAHPRVAEKRQQAAAGNGPQRNHHPRSSHLGRSTFSFA